MLLLSLCCSVICWENSRDATWGQRKFFQSQSDTGAIKQARGRRPEPKKSVKIQSERRRLEFPHKIDKRTKNSRAALCWFRFSTVLCTTHESLNVYFTISTDSRARPTRFETDSDKIALLKAPQKNFGLCFLGKAEIRRKKFHEKKKMAKFAFKSIWNSNNSKIYFRKDKVQRKKAKFNMERARNT